MTAKAIRTQMTVFVIVSWSSMHSKSGINKSKTTLQFAVSFAPRNASSSMSSDQFALILVTSSCRRMASLLTSNLRFMRATAELAHAMKRAEWV